MRGSMQKFSRLILVAGCLGAVGNFSNPLPSIAQDPKGATGKRPPVCEGSPPTGRVRCNYEGGDNYEGDFVNGKPDGRGIYVYSNGDRYEGQFRNGIPNGQGVFIFKDDARYSGLFQDGAMKSGTVLFTNGDRYTGEFQVVRNVANGQISSQPHGQGEFRYANGDRFVGRFFAGVPFGPGVLTRPDGTVCEGQFLNSTLDARNAQCRFSNGVRYQGELRKGVPHGLGTMTDSSGRRFTGAFREGKLAK
ncbi:MAG: MORN repeat-containing protein [Actinomycetota bacterium]